jgi:PAS domain S-box-containing protein
MSDQSKTKQVLIQELTFLKRKIANLEGTEAERKQVEEGLRAVNAYNRSLIEASIDPLVTISPDGKITDVNAATERATGCTRDVLIGSNFSNYFSNPELARVGYRQVFTEGHVRDYPLEICHRDGHITSVFYNAIIYHNEKGEVSGVFAAARDITERQRAEEKIKASLQEKETLLREIHHRVKNNMQVISSLLNLQARASGNPELTGLLNKSQSRIRSMALVHEKLYSSKNFARIDLVDYARSLSQELFKTYHISNGKIDLIIQTDGVVHVDINRAIPCGLILNELISNALKHAFPRDGHGKLQILINETKDKEKEIIVRDNGVGLPDNIDIHQPQSLGLELVNGLVKKQLDGQMELRRDNGTEFRIKFPL